MLLLCGGNTRHQGGYLEFNSGKRLLYIRFALAQQVVVLSIPRLKSSKV